MALKWHIPDQDVPIDPQILEAAESKAVLARILQQRGHDDPENIKSFLWPELYIPAPPEEMPGLERGVKRIEQAIERSERILVWGDFDVDGQTSTALLYSALHALGADVDYHIPVREKESHGIRPAFLKPYLEEGIHVLLSCDTGIAAHEAIQLANTYDVDVIVTDHHDCPEHLPDAYALINPKLFASLHPLSGLPGVGVAYKFIELLYDRAGRSDELTAFLDLVALGIVADLAILTEDTRYLLQRGLEQLRRTERVGLLELMENARVVPGYLIDEHIGFQLGPRLNAVGRLADANISVPLLTTVHASEAEHIAEELERLNEERRFQTELVYESALEQVQHDTSLLHYAVLVLAHPTWHQGVIGIVASRLVETFGKPAILLATPTGKLARGSARSIEGFHITQAIATQEDILEGYGGHPMAAGLAMHPEHLDQFRRGVSKAIIEQRTGEETEPVLAVDAVVALSNLDEHLVDELELLAPFGPGNPPINILCKNLLVTGQVLIGKDKAHRKLVVREEDGSEQKELLWWNSAEEALPEGTIDVVVRARPGFFRGERQLSITLQDFRVTGVRAEEDVVEQPFSILDLREVRDKEEMLYEVVLDNPGIQAWGEGGNTPDAVRSRMHLAPSSSLVIWTLPPSQAILLNVLEQVNPRRIYLFGVEPTVDRPDQFLKRFVGLIKYALAKDNGVTSLQRLAAAMAHTPETIRAALKVLPALGLSGHCTSEDVVQINSLPAKVNHKNADELEYLLRETSAFRGMLLQALDLSRYLFFKMAA